MAATERPIPLPEEPPISPARPAKPLGVFILVAACVVAYAACHFFSRRVNLAALVCCGAKDRELILQSHQWWRLVSAGFLHADPLHLGVNVYALIAVGSAVERLWGFRRFLLIYVAALLGGNAASLAAGTHVVSVGASGAVFGLLGAFLVFVVRHRHVLRPGARLRLLLNLVFVLVANVALGAAVPFIDNAAHLGGLAAGALAALVLRPVPVLGRPRPLGEALTTLAACAAAIGVLGSLAMAVRHARASEFLLLLGGDMERRPLAGEGLSVSVPRGWRYTPPKPAGADHIFAGPNVAVVGIRVLPREKVADLAAVATDVATQWRKDGAEHLSTRELALGEENAVEMLFRRKVRGLTERHRVVLFPGPGGRLVLASFVCLEARYKLLEVLFDRILNSIRPDTPRYGAEGTAPTEKLWEEVAEKPQDPDTAVALAARYAREGRPEPAERLLLATLQRHPRHAEAHNQLARLYATARAPYCRPQEAVRHALKATALKRDVPSYFATLALAYEAAGDRVRALDAAHRAAALAPDDATYGDLVKRLSN